jgi:hypothetical protein
MVHSTDMLGPMSEPERFVLMRRALRDKHLRFLHDQQKAPDQASLQPAGKREQASSGREDLKAPVGPAAPKRPAPAAVSGQDRQEPAKPDAARNLSPAAQAADALALRRLLESKNLTQEEYVKRLNGPAIEAEPRLASLPSPPSLPTSRLPCASEILHRLSRK